MLPKSKREVYGRPILDAISPSEPPFGQVRTYEELWKLIDGAVGSFHRRVWLLAAVWKTWIVANRVAFVGGTVIVLILIAVFSDIHCCRGRHRERHQHRVDLETLVGEGYVAYRTGDMVTARKKFGDAIKLSHFRIGDYSYFDVMGIYEDACERIGK